jgi:coenzyme F420-reducing hydrogenase alpha subunit
MPPDEWLTQTRIDELRAWADGGHTLPARIIAQWLQSDPALGASGVMALPPADRASIEAYILAPLGARPSFARAPTWNGEPRETGPCARNGPHPLVAACREAFGNGAVTRTVARLVEVARDVLRLRGECAEVIDAWSPACCEGVAIVQTARGMLVHAANVKAGRVARYAIIAPTEWNCHPDGALARGIATLSDGDANSLARRAETVVQTLDPCVAYRVEIGHA